MFDTKQKQLIEKKAPVKQSNLFIEEAFAETNTTKSGNGAKKYSSLLDNKLVEQFASVAYYKKPRSFKEINDSALQLYGEDSLNAVKFILYLRIITRKIKLMNGATTSDVQHGAGLKYESIFRMIWLHTYNPEAFWNNITLFIAAGSWKDVIQMLSYDLQYNGWDNRKLDWTKFGNLILSGLNDKGQSELIKKYLPQIKSNSACKTLESQADNLIGKWICSLLFGSKIDNSGSYKQYRKLKTSGTAHEWQKLISQRKFDQIDFNKIAGRALHILSKSKFLDNNGLRERYAAWITKPETKDVKFTGFVHELFEKIPPSITGFPAGGKETIIKQFDTMVRNHKAKIDEGVSKRLIVVRDTSASMNSQAQGLNMSSGNVAKALALYFAESLDGPFKDAWIEFHSTAQLRTWNGNNVLEKWYNDRSSFVGSTNFLSVIDLLCKMKTNGVPEDAFPSGILCISDMEFNPSPQTSKTNLESTFEKLKNAGFSESFRKNFIVVLWDIPNGYYGSKKAAHFETHSAGIGGLFYFSGYEPSVITFLTNAEIKTASELAKAAISQEICELVTL